MGIMQRCGARGPKAKSVWFTPLARLLLRLWTAPRWLCDDLAPRPLWRRSGPHAFWEMNPSPVSRASRLIARLATLTCALTLWLGMAARVEAQSDRRSLPAGTRVRVTTGAADQPFTGNVLRLTADTLAVATGGGNALLQLPTTRIASVEISEGRDRIGWAVRGAGYGALAGGFIGAASLRGHGGPGDLSAIAGFFAGGVLGGGFGSLIGAIIAPERWRRFPLSGLLR